MGTRNVTVVRFKKVVKVAQYCQWDGYPSGEGKVIAKFIQTKMNLEKFKVKVDQLEFKEWDGKGEELPAEYNRDTGAKILELIQEGDIKYLNDAEIFLYEGPFCEWGYLLDLDDETVTVFQNSDILTIIPFAKFTDEKMDELERGVFTPPPSPEPPKPVKSVMHIPNVTNTTGGDM
jgi:hypothetical protein